MQTIDKARSDKQQARNLYLELLIGHEIKIIGENHLTFGYEMLRAACDQMGLTPEEFRDHIDNELARQYKIDKIVRNYLPSVVDANDFSSDLTRRQLYAILKGSRPDLVPKESTNDMYARRISKARTNKLSRFDFRIFQSRDRFKRLRELFINVFLPQYVLPFIEIDENVLFNLYEKCCEKSFISRQLKKAQLTPAFYVETCDGLSLLHTMLPPRWETEERVLPTLGPGDIPLYRSETLYSYFRYKKTVEGYHRMPPLDLARQLKKDHQIYHLGMPTIDGLKALGVEKNIEPYIPWLTVFIENDESGKPIFDPKDDLTYPAANIDRLRNYLLPLYESYLERMARKKKK